MPIDGDDAGERRRKGKEEIGSGKREKAFVWKKGIRI
jgi:hypothetical protein